MLTLLLVPIGNVPCQLLNKVKVELPKIFQHILVDVTCESYPVPKEAYVPHRNQYLADYFVAIAERIANDKKKYHRVVIITDLNLFSGNLNFVFGVASFNGNGAVVSLHMLNPETYGEPFNEEIFVERIVKEVAHELGHTLGFSHCENPKCVMRFSNSIVDVDYKTKFFCRRCARILNKKLLNF
ncbi:MAG: archaemetzincin family Zn-dependent metalloprotease [Candidatus Asgardarchaeia archaeon]